MAPVDFRRWVLRLLLTLTVLLVLLVVAAVYLLVAHAAGDAAVSWALQWTVGTLAGAILADLALLVILLACERVAMPDQATIDEGALGETPLERFEEL